MSSVSENGKSTMRCLVEATAWRRQLTEAGMESSREFEEWRAADARHDAAWNQVQSMWDFVGDAEAAPELLELRRVALTNARNSARRRERRTWFAVTGFLGTAARRRVVFAAAVVAVTVVIANLVSGVHSGDVYRTQPGERRIVTLADGSRVQLDSSTELRVRFSAQQRELSLTRGQARFDVAHDFRRPFSVGANGRTVVATGTAFNVDVLGDDLLVTLIEGRVVVLPNQATVLPLVVSRSSDEGPPAAGANPGGCDGSRAAERAAARKGRSGTGIELKAGELLVVSADGCTSIVPANVERATAWENGQLILENETLRSVVERVSRYSREPIVIADDRVADLRISGVFRTDDVAGLVETLTLYLPIDADESDGSIRLSYR